MDEAEELIAMPSRRHDAHRHGHIQGEVWLVGSRRTCSRSRVIPQN